jgi:hypothetical protein
MDRHTRYEGPNVLSDTDSSFEGHAERADYDLVLVDEFDAL